MNTTLFTFPANFPLLAYLAIFSTFALENSAKSGTFHRIFTRFSAFFIKNTILSIAVGDIVEKAFLIPLTPNLHSTSIALTASVF